MGVTLRPAVPADLPLMADIWLDSAFGPERPPAMPEPPYLAHELATGHALMAEADGAAVGYGIMLTRGSVANLAELFVRRGAQSAGAGRALLAALMEGTPRQVFTVASHDRRALALYARAGMLPRWPYYYLQGETARLRLPPTDLEAVLARWDDAAWIAWDAMAAGRPRAQEHAYWRDARGGHPLWLRRRGRVVGYGVVQTRLPEQAGAPDAATVGPLIADRPANAVDALFTAAAWARARGAPRIDVCLCGPHAAFVPALEAGFRIVDQDTVMSTRTPGFCDPKRYVPSGAEFF